MVTFFIALQLILLFYMLFHDWIPLAPFNDIPTLKKTDSNARRLLGSAINGVMVLIPLIITWIYFSEPRIPLAASIIVVLFYAVITFGTIISWWIPYYYGSSKSQKERFSKFKNTHHFLPPRGDHVVPNTLHVVLHVLVWVSLLLALYFLIVRS